MNNPSVSSHQASKTATAQELECVHVHVADTSKFPLSEALIWAIQALVSILGLILLSPLMLLIAIVIKLTDYGPVFYRGDRVGYGKQIFKIYKFRTLIVGAEQQIGARLLSKEDQERYYTRIGRFLKRGKLDELPQLFNVIRGEMRLAGPRPSRPIFLEQCERAIANYASRFLVPPGVTGIAQLRGGYYTSPRNKLRYDLIYIKRRSLLLDFHLVFLTFAKILYGWLNIGFFMLFLFLLVSFIPASVLPSLHLSISGMKINLVYLMIFLGVGGLFLKMGSTQAALYRNPLNLSLCLFIVLSTVSAFFYQDLYDAFSRANYYVITGFLVSLLIVNSLATEALIHFMTRVIALTSVAMSVFGLFQIFLFNQAIATAAAPLPQEQLLVTYARASSFLGNPVVLAVYLVLGLPLLLAEVMRSSTRRGRDFWLICTTISFIGIFFTQTRIGLLALLVTGTVFLSRRLTHALYFSAGLVLFFVLILPLGNPRFSVSGIRGEVTQWVQQKAPIVQAIPLKTWLIGGGAERPRSLETAPVSSSAQGPIRKKTEEIPNMHLTLVLEYGLLGWGIIMWLIFSVLRTIKQAHDKAKDEQLKPVLWAIFSSILGFLVSMNAMNVFHNLALQIFFWSLIGIGLGIVLHVNGSRRNNLIWRFGDAGDW